MEKKKSNKKSFFSIRVKILLLVFLAIITTGFICIESTIPRLRTQITDISGSYLLDMATLLGRRLDQSIQDSSAKQVLDYRELDKQLAGFKISNMESSYVYVVANNGTMLYHPAPAKIGLPVENGAVKQVVGQISNGIRPEPGVIQYTYAKAQKYAAYYVGENKDFILVVTADEKDFVAAVSKVRNMTISFAIAGLILCTIIAYIVSGLIVKPIIKISEVMEKMGDMDFRDDGTLNIFSYKMDETGVMSRAMIQMRKELHSTIQGISGQCNELHGASETVKTSAGHTADSVDQVEKAISEIAQGASSQAQETQTATENIILMGDMIEETKREIDSLRESANVMNAAGDKALSILADLDTSNQKTKDAINIVYQQTNTTNDSAMKIKAATDVISEIAEETNLLSLNASIEAARAGEQGRGFAVVASQIQKLAEQSNNSAQEIAIIINELISDAAKSVETMENLKEVIKQQDEYVKNTESSFRDVSDRIGKSIEGIHEIAAKTQTLNEARVRVVDIVQNLTAVAEENAASTQETSASVTEVGNTMNEVSEEARHLNGIATALESSVKKFTL